MNILEDVVDSTPIIGHVKATVHYVTGDSEKGQKALYKSTRSTAVIAGGTVGCMLGPGGAVAGAIYAGAATDSVATIATKKPHGYIKHTEDVKSDIESGRDPSKSMMRFGVEIYFDGATGVGINSNATSFSEIPGSVRDQVLAKSVFMTQKDFAQKVTKNVLKHSIYECLKDD